MGIDSQLLSRKEKPSVGDKLRKDKRTKGPKERGDSGYSLRQQQAIKRIEKKEKREKEVSGSFATKSTDKALQTAWKSIIPTWGLSFLYVNLHVILAKIFGHNLFSKLGYEWIPANIKNAKPEIAEKIGRRAHMGEMLLWLLLNIILAAILLLIIAMIIVIIDLVSGVPDWFVEKIIL